MNDYCFIVIKNIIKEIISIFDMAGLIAKKNQAKLAEQIYKQTHCE